MDNAYFFKRNQRIKPLTMFREMFLPGWIHRLWSKLTRQHFQLLDLDDTLKKKPVEASYYAGIKPVKTNSIRGSEGKIFEFDAEFNPTQENSRSRWISIALEKLQGRDLPPVELIPVDEIYYVRDGHHHISVSRAMGQRYMDAEVTIRRLRQQSLFQ